MPKYYKYCQQAGFHQLQTASVLIFTLLPLPRVHDTDIKYYANGEDAYELRKYFKDKRVVGGKDKKAAPAAAAAPAAPAAAIASENKNAFVDVN